MIVRVFKQAEKATILDEVIVATDDKRIADAVTENGGKAVITNGSFTCGTERVAAVAKNYKADIIVNIQGDEPLIMPSAIANVVNILIDNPRSVMSTACAPLTKLADIDNPNIVKVVLAADNRVLYFSRSRIPWFAAKTDLELEAVLKDMPVYRHLGIYGFTAEFLQTFASLEPTPLEKAERLEQLRALEHGYKIIVGVAPYRALGIDTPEDYRRFVARWRHRHA